MWSNLNGQKYSKQHQYDEGYQSIYLLFLISINCGLRLGEAIEPARETEYSDILLRNVSVLYTETDKSATLLSVSFGALHFV